MLTKPPYLASVFLQSNEFENNVAYLTAIGSVNDAGILWTP